MREGGREGERKRRKVESGWVVREREGEGEGEGEREGGREGGR